MLSDKQLNEFRKILQDRDVELREEIRQELLDSDEEHYIDLAGQVHDLEEESVADLLVDLDLAEIDRHVEEIREIDAALLRIARGSYGICAECEDEIEVERLHAYPTARRCEPCQANFERNHLGPKRSTL